MKALNISYWIVTGLAAAMMLLSGIPNMLSIPDAVELISHHLGYPAYFVPYIGIAKIVGSLALVIPGIPRIKEWAYAGLIFDLVSAIYSALAVGDSVLSVLPILLPIFLVIVSYILYHRRLNAILLSSPAL